MDKSTTKKQSNVAANAFFVERFDWFVEWFNIDAETELSYKRRNANYSIERVIKNSLPRETGCQNMIYFFVICIFSSSRSMFKNSTVTMMQTPNMAGTQPIMALMAWIAESGCTDNSAS